MPDPESKPTVDPLTLAEAQRVQTLLGATAAKLKAAGMELIAHLGAAIPGEPPLIDGEPAMVAGEELDPVTLLVETGTGIATVEITEVAELLLAKAGADPVELVAIEVREYREGLERAAERAKRIPSNGEPEEPTN